MLFNRAGESVAVAQREHSQIYPEPGRVEHDALEIWTCTRDVVAETLSKAGVGAVDIAAVGITNQRETTVIWNKKTGKPYHNALVWQDMRTSQILDALALDGGRARFRRQTGLPLATYFSGPKIKWLLDNVDGLRSDAERGDAIFGNIDTWLIWNLTGGVAGGVHVTDVTNASRTMLMDLEGLAWSSELAAAMDIPLAMLPEIRPSSDPDLYGYTTDTGPFGGRIPVCGDLGDQQAAMVGQCCFEAGEIKNTYGTGCFMLLNTGNEIKLSSSGLLTTVCYRFDRDPAAYALEGSVAISGALVQWLRDNLRLIETAPEIEKLALTVADNGGVYFVPAFSGLFAPYWREDARGVIAGLTRYVNNGHIARAALEATAYQTFEVLEAMQTDLGAKIDSLKVDGGMVVNELLMQFQADLLNIPVIRPAVAETTALGAAYAAGLAVGIWSGTDQLRRNWRVGGTWQPSADDTARTVGYRKWKKAVKMTFNWLDD